MELSCPRSLSCSTTQTSTPASSHRRGHMHACNDKNESTARLVASKGRCWISSRPSFACAASPCVLRKEAHWFASHHIRSIDHMHACYLVSPMLFGRTVPAGRRSYCLLARGRYMRPQLVVSPHH
jgi:hypothetical protein